LVLCLIQQIAAATACRSGKQARLLGWLLKKMALLGVRNALGSSDCLEVFSLNNDSV